LNLRLKQNETSNLDVSPIGASHKAWKSPGKYQYSCFLVPPSSPALSHRSRITWSLTLAFRDTMSGGYLVGCLPSSPFGVEDTFQVNRVGDGSCAIWSFIPGLIYWWIVYWWIVDDWQAT